MYLGGHPWLLAAASRTQATIAQSSAEAELVAACTAVSEGKFVQAVFLELGHSMNLVLHTDSSASLGIMHRLGPGSRLKHVEIRLFWIQDEIRRKRLTATKVDSLVNVSDAFTKHLGTEAFVKFRAALGIRETLDLATVSSCLPAESGDKPVKDLLPSGAIPFDFDRRGGNFLGTSRQNLFTAGASGRAGNDRSVNRATGVQNWRRGAKSESNGK